MQIIYDDQQQGLSLRQEPQVSLSAAASAGNEGAPERFRMGDQVTSLIRNEMVYRGASYTITGFRVNPKKESSQLWLRETGSWHDGQL